MSQRGYAQFVDVQVEPALAWAACTDVRWLCRWYAVEAQVDPRKGGRYCVKTKDGRVRDAIIDVWDPPRRLRLIYAPESGLVAPGGEDGGPVVEDLLIDAKPGRTVIRVFGAGVPGTREWDAWYQKTRLAWAYWLHRLKVALDEEAGTAPPAVAANATKRGTP